MPKEIERKFLVDFSKLEGTESKNFKTIVQGYISTSSDTTVRVRLALGKGYITVKGKTEGITRSEYEYEIPYTDAEEMIQQFCADTISKVRYEIDYKGHTLEVDIFGGSNNGLIVAEIELTHEMEEFEIPEWCIIDVTDDHRYSNSNLVKNPYCNW